MLRRAWSYSAAISLAMFVAGIVFWVRCYQYFDSLSYVAQHRGFETATSLTVSQGELSLRVADWSGLPWRQEGWSINSIPLSVSPYSSNTWTLYTPRSVTRVVVASSTSSSSRGGSLLGFSFQFARAAPTWWRIAVPMWFVVIASAVLPALWTRSWIIKRHRSRPGVCKKCGYDLTGNASGICPECGLGIERQ